MITHERNDYKSKYVQVISVIQSRPIYLAFPQSFFHSITCSGRKMITTASCSRLLVDAFGGLFYREINETSSTFL